MSLKITSIKGLEIIDSRGNPTIEACVTLSDGSRGYGQVPAGASTGKHEAVELRDGDKKRYLGLGVTKAVGLLDHDLKDVLLGRDPYEQEAIDSDLIELDGTVNKDRLGANTLLSASLAVADAAANSLSLPLYQYMGGEGPFQLPVPMLNIINGGAHANNAIDIQEFMIVPLGFSSFNESLRASVEVYHHLRTALDEKKLVTAVGDEGGFAPNLKSNAQALDYLMQAIEKAGYRPGDEIAIALDVASSELYKDNTYHFAAEKKKYSAEELVGYYKKLIKKYPIVSIEDGLAEDDWQGWQHMMTELGKQVQLVGDDLFVTNMNLLNRGIKEAAANAILIKLNQIGTLTETLKCIGLAKNHKFHTIISHRSGETESAFIADLAVATMAGQIKAGAPCRSDRTCKYNQLLRIEADEGKNACYAGKLAYPLAQKASS
jgi:enolase